MVAGGLSSTQQDAVAAIWDQHRPTMLDRVALLERAQLDPTLRARAREAAHQLAGTAGTFGFSRASELAHKCEQLLISDAGAFEMAEWVAGIRADISAGEEAGPEAPGSDPHLTPLPLLLVVTEDPGMAERMRAEAGRRGLRVVSARAVEADRKLAANEPAAVLLDLSAPGADALLDAHPVVLALNGTDRAEIARRGAAAFLDEHTTPAEAIDHVSLLLQRNAPATERVLVVGTDPAPLEELELVVDADPFAGQVDCGAIVLGPGELDLCRMLRNDPRWSTVPIVVVGTGDPEPAFAAGADDVAPSAQLLPRVRNHLARHRVHQALADTDPLTGLRNRRTSSAALSHLLRLAERLERPVCLVELDIDHFKRVNDVHGHVAGDVVLRRLGDLLRRSFRGEDVVARWGGEEFVVGLFGLDRDGGVDRISDLLGRFRAETFTGADGEAFQVSFSAGIAQYPADGADLESLYVAADEALYAAKRGGRNQVAGAGDGPHATQQVDVAIIEDEDATSELIAHALNGRGLRTFRFSNGAVAVQMLLGERPRVRARVILLDLNLPAVDGMDLLMLFEREGVLRSSRALVVSAQDDPGTMARARSLGAIDYLVKPIDLDDLSLRVDASLGRRP